MARQSEESKQKANEYNRRRKAWLKGLDRCLWCKKKCLPYVMCGRCRYEDNERRRGR